MRHGASPSAEDRAIRVNDLLFRAASRRETTKLRARWILPIDAPAIENGEVVIAEGKIVAVGPAQGETDWDFGEAAILPGFVNVHAHLEYTIMRGLLEDMPFFPWIRLLTALKAYITPDEWRDSARLGAAEMLAAGITAIGDACDGGYSLNALLESGQRGIVYREVFGIAPQEPVESIVADLQAKVTAMAKAIDRNDPRIRIGISPHAPYTVRAALFQALGQMATAEKLPQTIHVAESPAEDVLFRQGTGPFAEMFARRGIPWQTPGVSPVQYLDSCGALTPGTLVVHCVHADAADAALLKARGAAVAHCPKSNGKLAAGFAPIRTLLDAGLAVGLGTDSVASNNNADMFEEMRAAVFTARAREQDVMALTTKEALYMATLGGARALGMDNEIGSLKPGKRADLCIVRLTGEHIAPANDNPEAALVFSAHASDVALTLVGGVNTFRGHFSFDIEDAQRRRAAVRRKIREALPPEMAKLAEMMQAAGGTNAKTR